MQGSQFDAMVVANMDFIDNVARKLAGRYRVHHLWEDIRQEAVERMLRMRESYDAGRPFRTLAYAVIHNTSCNHSTCEHRHRRAEMPPLPYRPHTEAGIDAEAIHALLNDETRLFIEGYTYREICAMTGRGSISTVNLMINRCAGEINRALGLNRKAVGRKGYRNFRLG